MQRCLLSQLHEAALLHRRDEVRYLAGMPPAHKRLYDEDVKHSLLQDFCQVNLTVYMLCPSQPWQLLCTSDRPFADQLLTAYSNCPHHNGLMYISHVHQMLRRCL